ncbi:MAG: MmcQ/YjbR family DNA-binding protein [Blastocatellia bacterium]|nr:MmcQ/YjbR family DNA-binding protein [Blastocatellia bacterium]
MDIEQLREYCLSFPHATENIQWGNDLVFKIGGKMFVVVNLENQSLSLPVSPEQFAELTERPTIRPAPYVARYHWILLERLDALLESELKDLIKGAFTRTFEKLPKKVRNTL